MNPKFQVNGEGIGYLIPGHYEINVPGQQDIDKAVLFSRHEFFQHGSCDIAEGNTWGSCHVSCSENIILKKTSSSSELELS